MKHKILFDWYQHHKRDLPWRQTKEPYKVWLSEIILQQTRVQQGLSYYKRFMEDYPKIQDLAQASEQDVLNLWQGLGYYSRARNLHFTAKDIIENYAGIFPNNYKQLLKLKGVGTYTAAAIASFCYDEAVAVLDGNVFRVLSRIYGVETPIDSNEGKRIFGELAQKKLDRKHPADYNQAIMEFGALHCTPKQPQCSDCPFSADCVAFQTGKTDWFPVKSKKIKQKERFLNFLLIKNHDEIIIEKRTHNDIWKNMYQLPLIEKSKEEDIKEEEMDLIFKRYGIKKRQMPMLIHQQTHKLTHQNLHIRFWLLKFDEKNINAVKINQINRFPMPIVIVNFLDNYL